MVTISTNSSGNDLSLNYEFPESIKGCVWYMKEGALIRENI